MSSTIAPWSRNSRTAPCIIGDATAADRDRLEAIVACRNSLQKQVWRAAIVLATAHGLGTVANMQRKGESETAVWRWQERLTADGVESLLHEEAMQIVLDSYAVHKHSKVIAWPSRHLRVTFHFTPTSASWHDAIEGFFATALSPGSDATPTSASLTSRPLSTATWPSTMPTRSPFDGWPTPLPSSPQHAGARR